jgi:hypothetical protein
LLAAIDGPHPIEFPFRISKFPKEKTLVSSEFRESVTLTRIMGERGSDSSLFPLVDAEDLEKLGVDLIGSPQLPSGFNYGADLFLL